MDGLLIVKLAMGAGCMLFTAIMVSCEQCVDAEVAVSRTLCGPSVVYTWLGLCAVEVFGSALFAFTSSKPHEYIHSERSGVWFAKSIFADGKQTGDVNVKFGSG